MSSLIKLTVGCDYEVIPRLKVIGVPYKHSISKYNPKNKRSVNANEGTYYYFIDAGNFEINIPPIKLSRYNEELFSNIITKSLQILSSCKPWYSKYNFKDSTRNQCAGFHLHVGYNNYLSYREIADFNQIFSKKLIGLNNKFRSEGRLLLGYGGDDDCRHQVYSNGTSGVEFRQLGCGILEDPKYVKFAYRMLVEACEEFFSINL
jgi:hypothetical protein